MNFHSITRVALPTTFWLLKQNWQVKDIVRGAKSPGQVRIPPPLVLDDDDVVGRGLSALHDVESFVELIAGHWAHGRQLREQIQVPEIGEIRTFIPGNRIKSNNLDAEVKKMLQCFSDVLSAA